MSRLLRGKNVAEGFFSKDIDKTVDLVYNGGKKKGRLPYSQYDSPAQK